MNDLKVLHKTLLKTWDGWSVILWGAVYLSIFIKSVLEDGFSIDQVKFLFFCVIAWLIFTRFRMTSEHKTDTNIFALLSINLFGFFIIYKGI